MIIRCSKDPYECIPCCDFCKYVKHDVFEHDGKHITGGPIGCTLHPDREHQDIAQCCGYCDDFVCARADKKSGMWFEGWEGFGEKT